MSVDSKQQQPSAGQRSAWPSINALFADRAKSMRDAVFLCIPKPGAVDHPSTFAYDEYTFGQVDGLVNELAASYAAKLPPKQPGVPTRVIGLYAPSGFDYALNSLALYRLGHSVIMLSTNNSTAALAHLIKITSISTLLHSSDKANSVESLKPLLQQQRLSSVELQQWTTVSEAAQRSLAATMQPSQYTSALSHEEEKGELAFSIHSSGSTGFPKPNFFT